MLTQITQAVEYVVLSPLSAIAVFMSFAAAAAVVQFMWGAEDYFYSHDNETEKGHGRVSMIQATAWLVFIVLGWELVRWIAGFF